MTPKIGDLVHYVLDHGPSMDEHRPAFVVRVWSEKSVNLQVFTDSDPNMTANDCMPQVLWATSIAQDEETKAGRTWHYPEP